MQRNASDSDSVNPQAPYDLPSEARQGPAIAGVHARTLNVDEDGHERTLLVKVGADDDGVHHHHRDHEARKLAALVHDDVVDARAVLAVRPRRRLGWRQLAELPLQIAPPVKQPARTRPLG